MLARRGEITPPWGVPGDRLGEHPVCQHPGTQPLPQELEHPAVRHPQADQAEQAARGRSAPKKSAMSASKTKGLPCFEADPELLQGVGGRAPGSKPKAARQEVGLEDRLEDDLGGLLAHPVHDSGDTQRAIGSRRALGCAPGALAPGGKCLHGGPLELVEHALDPKGLHRRMVS